MPGAGMQVKGAWDNVEILASAARTATGNSQADARKLPRSPSGMAFQLAITADEQAAGDTLDVIIQTRLDGVNWVDVMWVPQQLGNGAAAPDYIIGKILADGQFMITNITDAALAAGFHRNLLGDDWAVRWVIVDGSGNASFTFDVTAIPM